MNAALNESARLGASRELDLKNDDCLQPMILESQLLEGPRKKNKILLLVYTMYVPKIYLVFYLSRMYLKYILFSTFQA